MSGEDKERLQQIRQQATVNYGDSVRGWPTVQMKSDIDFLLSLVKSQGQLLERVPLAQSALTQLDELRAANKRAAASMRSACVEKVKAFATEKWNKQYEAQGQASALLRAEADAVNEIAVLLESLSIEQPKE